MLNAVTMTLDNSNDSISLPEIFTMSEAVAAGMTADQVRQRVRSGRWAALGSGTYSRSLPPADDLDPFAQRRNLHVQLAVARALKVSGSVIAFGSAAMLHQLPLVTGTPQNVELLVPPGAWTGTRTGTRYRSGALAPTEISHLPAPVTTPLRTWLDIARSHPFADAICCGDAALHSGLFTVAALDAALPSTDIRGSSRVHRASRHLNMLRESALESLSWVRFLDWDIELPTCQFQVTDRGGRFVARVDFCWEDKMVIGEADGRLKYTNKESLYQEKLREDRLRELGFEVIRWSWSDLLEPAAVLKRRISTALTPSHHTLRSA